MSAAEKSWASRKLGAESSATRAALIQAARKLIAKEGYAAVTSRRVAAEAQLKPQLVHYYFRSMEDLLVEVLRGTAEETLVQLREILQSDKPLRALRIFAEDPRSVAFTTEFTALASRSHVIRDELARYAEEMRALQTEAIEKHLKARGIEPRMAPVVVTVLLVSLSSVMVREKALGMKMGHAETEAFVEECLKQFDEHGQPPASIFSP